MTNEQPVISATAPKLAPMPLCPEIAEELRLLGTLASKSQNKTGPREGSGWLFATPAAKTASQS